jgi:Flp pilus assembly protein TadD
MSEAYELFQEGREELRRGRAAEATGALERARDLEPGKASIREALGIAYFRASRWAEAEAEFRALLVIAPTDAFAHRALARALANQGRDREANRHFKLAGA